MPTLYLIDGYAQFFRAYHAIRTPMTSPVTKEPTNLTFGFVGMLLRLLRAEDELLRGDGAPTHLAVALDVSGDRGTFRSRLYPEYKATRDAPPDDLPPQVRRCIELLDAIGVPTIGAEGFEADDVIATIASRYSEEHPDVRVRIVSKDKDLKQLLGAGAPPTEMYDIHTGGLITEQTLRDEAGITPAQVIDTLALMGDTSDNVPGVPGIGEKTALKLIAEFGGLDQVIAEVTADKPKKDWIIKGKRRENILASLETLALSKELVTLRRDAPAQLDLDAARTDTLDLARLLPLLKELGFGRYQDDVKALLGLPKAGDEASATTPPARTRNTGEEAGAFGGLFDQREAGDDTSPADGDYTVVRTRDQLDQMLTEIRNAELLAVDTETTALRPMLAQLAGICLSDRPGRGWYVPVRAPQGDAHLDEQTVLDALRPALEDASIAKLGHNIKYDMLVLRRAGVRLAGHLPGQLPEGDAQALAGDTMIASYLIDASRSSHSLDALSLGLLGRENVSITSLIGTGKKQKRFDEVPLDKAGPYAAEDADVTLRLAQRLVPPLQEMDLLVLYRDLEMPLVEVLAELEYNGILVDPGELDRQRERLEGEIERLKARIDDELYGAIGRTIDHDSPKQLSGALFAKPDAAEPGLGITPIKRTKTGYSTDAEVLTKLADDASVESPVPALVLEYRQLAKLVGTYLGSLKDEINPATGRIHASFNQTVAATGRLSSSDPNLQNIPIRTEVGREIRKAFIAPPERVLVSADYSQIELRLLAHLSRDPALIEAFRAGEDIHSAVAAQIRGIPLSEVTKEQRSGAKMVNFGIVYGITAFGLARRLGVSNSEADEIITGYKKRFSGITTFLEECVAHAREHGYVETMCKRRRPIPDIESNQPNRRALAERTAINSVVQGSAADLIKIAMVDLHRRLATARDNARDPLGGVLMLLQIHDELVFEAPQAGAEKARDVIVERMEAAMDLDVPLVADSSISQDWFGGK